MRHVNGIGTLHATLLKILEVVVVAVSCETKPKTQVFIVNGCITKLIYIIFMFAEEDHDDSVRPSTDYHHWWYHCWYCSISTNHSVTEIY